MKASQAVSWKRQRSQYNLFSSYEYCTGGFVRSENEARILYTVEKGIILQSNSGHLEKIHRRATRRNYFAFISTVSRGTALSLHFQVPMYGNR